MKLVYFPLLQFISFKLQTQIDMDHEELKSINIEYPKINPAVEFREGGLYSTSEIPAGELILSIRSCKTLNKNTIPTDFCPHIKYEEDRIIAYLIYLKKMKEDLPQHVQQWLGRDTHGFTSFSRESIQASKDLNLRIEYFAYRRERERRGSEMWGFIGQQLQKMGQQQFQAAYEWAEEFKRTRAFGYTKDTLLVPYFDYLNYNPAEKCNVMFVTYESEEELVSEAEKQLGQIEESPSAHEQKEDDQLSQSSYQSESSRAPTKKYLAILASKTIPPNSQLFFDYGHLSNLSLLQQYGYTVKDNPYNFLTIYLSKYPQDQMIQYCPLDRTMHTIKICGRDERTMRVSARKLMRYWLGVHQAQGVQGEEYAEYLGQLIKALKGSPPPMIDMSKILEYQNEEQQKVRRQMQWIQIYHNGLSQIHKSLLTLLTSLSPLSQNPSHSSP